jgi:hypothetical protein
MFFRLLLAILPSATYYLARVPQRSRRLVVCAPFESHLPWKLPIEIAPASAHSVPPDTMNPREYLRIRFMHNLWNCWISDRVADA